MLLAAYATLLVRRSRVRLDARRAAAIAVAAVAAAIVLVGLDAVAGGSSHVTHAVGDGPGAVLGDIADRLELSARRTFAAIGPAFAVCASLVVLAVVATRRPRRPLTDAVLVALLVSLVVNDTPGDVVGFGAVAAFVIRRFEDGSARGARTHLVRLPAMRRPLAALALLLAMVALVAAGCGGEEVTATPETVVGTLPEETATGPSEDLPALALKGDATAGKQVFESAGCVACHTLSAANATGTVGPNLDEAKPSVRARRPARDARPGRHAVLQGSARAAADRRRRTVRLHGDGRLSHLPDFAPRVQAFASDLDGTLIASDGVVHDRTRAAIARSQSLGVPVLVATGRMFRSVERYLDDVGLPEPVVCYQGAAVVDPRTRTFLLHEPLALDVAREAIAALGSRSASRRTSTSTTSSTSPRRASTRAGTPSSSACRWSRSATCSRGSSGRRRSSSPSRSRPCWPRSAPSSSAGSTAVRSSRRRCRTCSRSAIPSVTKGSGLAFVAAMLGLDLDRVVAFGDGENDVELLDAAGFGVAVEGAHPRLQAIADATCPGPARARASRP